MKEITQQEMFHTLMHGDFENTLIISFEEGAMLQSWIEYHDDPGGYDIVTMSFEMLPTDRLSNIGEIPGRYAGGMYYSCLDEKGYIDEDVLDVYLKEGASEATKYIITDDVDINTLKQKFDGCVVVIYYTGDFESCYN